MTDLAAKIKSPIWVSRFEINWSASKIKLPRANEHVNVYTTSMSTNYVTSANSIGNHILN